MILTNPNEKVLEEELPELVDREGITSIKIYMTCMFLLQKTWVQKMILC